MCYTAVMRYARYDTTIVFGTVFAPFATAQEGEECWARNESTLSTNQYCLWLQKKGGSGVVAYYHGGDIKDIYNWGSYSVLECLFAVYTIGVEDLSRYNRDMRNTTFRGIPWKEAAIRIAQGKLPSLILTGKVNCSGLTFEGVDAIQLLFAMHAISP